MNIRNFIDIIKGNEKYDMEIVFVLPNGEKIPSHYHLTEVGLSTKKFIDCGGVQREKVCYVLQFWTANDLDHRLKGNKLVKILEKAVENFGNEDKMIEIEYGECGISIFGIKEVILLITNEQHEITVNLFNIKTDCLAKDKCGVSSCLTSCC